MKLHDEPEEVALQRESTMAIFDQQAPTYDEQWPAMAPVRDALQFVVGGVFAKLPADANVLCVGAGTGAELFYLAERYPGWRFTAVEPSRRMFEILRRKAEARGIASRCVFHHGYLPTLPPSAPFDSATSILVSQFVTEPAARGEFFREIAERLRIGGDLVSADLACDIQSEEGLRLLDVWFEMLSVAADARERTRQAYGRQVAVVPPEDVCAIITSGGFDTPVQCFQGGLIHAWYAQRSLGA